MSKLKPHRVDEGDIMSDIPRTDNIAGCESCPVLNLSNTFITGFSARPTGELISLTIQQGEQLFLFEKSIHINANKVKYSPCGGCSPESTSDYTVCDTCQYKSKETPSDIVQQVDEAHKRTDNSKLQFDGKDDAKS